MAQTVLLGFLTGIGGFLPGAFLSVFLKKVGSRVQGVMMGATGGLLMAFICFEMLEASFSGENGVALSSVGILLGAVLALVLEGAIPKAAKGFISGEISLSVRTGVMIALSTAIHNIPEGMSIGAMYSVSPTSAVSLALIVGLHCFPEALAVFIPLRKAGASAAVMLPAALLFGLPLAFGSFLGNMFSQVSSSVSSLLLSLAAGVMLFTACGHIFPESKKIWNGRMSALGAVVGFIAGVLLTA